MSKRDELRQKHRKQQQRERIILIAVIVGLALIVSAALILPGLTNSQQAAAGIIQPTEFPRPQANGRSMGDPNAPVKVIEYADFLCSHCQDFAVETEPEIVEKYVATGKVYFTYAPFLLQANVSSRPAEASFCALDQGKFWQYHDTLYVNLKNAASSTSSSGDPTDLKHLETYAQNLGMNVADFKQCLSSGKHAQTAKDTTQEGMDAGVQGTPSFLVGTKLVYQDELIATIEEALKASGN